VVPIYNIGTSRVCYKKFYAKQLKNKILSMRADDLNLTRLKLIGNKISKSKSQIISLALCELYSTKYLEVI
jgi:hypothetical protein